MKKINKWICCGEFDKIDEDSPELLSKKKEKNWLFKNFSNK